MIELYTAAKNNQLEVVKKILQAGSNIDWQNEVNLLLKGGHN